jgi:hypothetical protein
MPIFFNRNSQQPPTPRLAAGAALPLCNNPQLAELKTSSLRHFVNQPTNQLTN